MLLIAFVLVFSLVSMETGGSLAYATTQQPANCSQCKSPWNGKASCDGSSTCRVQCNDGFMLVNETCNRGCPAGTQLNKAGKCKVCPRNTFKSTNGVEGCKRCPSGKVTVGLQSINRAAETDCIPGGMRLTGSAVKGLVLTSILETFQQSLDFVPYFMGKGGGRRNGCMINCDAEDTAVGAAEAFLAGSPPAYKSDEPWMGLSGRLPQVKAQAPCATVVSSALSSVLEATLASLQNKTTTNVSPLSPTYTYFCSPPGARKCVTGWTNVDAANAVMQHPAAFFAPSSCAGADAIDAPVCSRIASKCNSSIVSECAVEALDAFYTIQRSIRRNGAVLSSMLLDGSLKLSLDTAPDGIYNATLDSKAKGVLRSAVTLVGYDNLNYYWWVLLPFGPGFGNNGLVKIAYGAAGVGNPEDTYALNCKLADSAVTRPMPRNLQANNQTGCYWYTAQQGEYVAGIADVFQLDIMQFVSDNAANGVFSFVDNESKQPDLQQSLAGKELQVCGIHPDLFRTAVQLDCPPGQEADGMECMVCPEDTYNPGTAKSCMRCPTGTVTVGITPADHDEASDCKPAADYLLCDKYIGKTTKSGVYPVTISGKEYQVYCDMETDGGGWILVMNYNKKAGTAPSPYIRSLQDGFPLLNNTDLGFDESKSTGVGGSWGAMDFSVLGALPKLTEFRLCLRNGDGTIHLKSAERNSFLYIRTGKNDPLTSGDAWDGYTLPTHGLQLLRMQQDYTPLPGHTQATLTDLINAPSRSAIMAFEKNSLWVDGLMTGDRFNTHAQLWLRGSAGSVSGCPAGTFAVGWGCHICPEGSYKDAAGAADCDKCPSGMVTGIGSSLRGREAAAHDSIQDCKKATPNTTLDRPGGGYLDIYTYPLLTAPQAEEVCNGAGGHLVSVTNLAIDTLLSSLSDPPYRLSMYWTGGLFLLANGDVKQGSFRYWCQWLSKAVSDRDFGLYIHFTDLSQLYSKDSQLQVPLAYVVFIAWPPYAQESGHWMAILPESLLPFVCERF